MGLNATPFVSARGSVLAACCMPQRHSLSPRTRHQKSALLTLFKKVYFLPSLGAEPPTGAGLKAVHPPHTHRHTTPALAAEQEKSTWAAAPYQVLLSRFVLQQFGEVCYIGIQRQLFSALPMIVMAL